MELSLGAVENVESMIALKYEAIPENVQIGSVTIVLKSSGSITNDMSLETSRVTAHDIMQDWQE